jgi:hypothetical protein
MKISSIFYSFKTFNLFAKKFLPKMAPLQIKGSNCEASLTKKNMLLLLKVPVSSVHEETKYL